MAQFYGTNAHDVIVGGAEADEIYGEGGNDILSGGDEDDYIVGGLGNDELHGDAGNDLLFGDYQSRSAGGHDRIYGGDGNDIAYGGGGHDVIEGGAGDDFLVGDDGDDFLIGGDGDDILRGGTGIDTYDGGAQSSGNSALNPGVGDRVSFFDLRATQGVIADLRTGIISNDGFGNVETMTGIEALGGGTAFADAFYGNDERNFFLGARGDTLVGFGGDDYFQLSGGAAALIDGGAGRDYLLLSSSGSYEPDRTGDGVADQVPAMTIGYTVDLAAGTITDGHGHSGTIVSIEMIGATELDDVLLGSDADEWFSPGQGSDRVDGRGGTDTVSYARDQYDYYYGLAGGVFIDLAAGVAIETRAEPDFVDNTNSDDIVSAPTGTAGPGSEAKSTDLLAGIENVVGSGLGDTIYGDDGDNRIAPGAGNDIVDGRGGSDTIDYSAARAPVEVRLDQGRTYEQGTGKLRLELTPNNSIFGTLVWADDHSASVDQFTGIENAVGSAFDDILVGDGGSNRLEGGGGNDRIDGGAGADSMLGGTGNDIYFVDQNGDMVLEDAGEGIDEVRTALGSRSDFAAMYILPANVENLTGTSATGQGVYGNALDNVIKMGAGGDLIVLQDGGDDRVESGGGNDFIYYGVAFTNADSNDGGTGNDTVGLLGNYTLTFDADDLVSIEALAAYSSGNPAAPNSYNLTTVDANVAAGGHLTVTGMSLSKIETLVFNGAAETDGRFTIFGGRGDDTITGSMGKDLIWGNLGADVLRGGGGNDSFEYYAVAESTPGARDIIMDFSAGDKINLWNIDADGNAANGNSAFAFIGNAAFSGAAGELRAVQDATHARAWIVEGDIDGDGQADFSLVVVTQPGYLLGAGDFIL